MWVQISSRARWFFFSACGVSLRGWLLCLTAYSGSLPNSFISFRFYFVSCAHCFFFNCVVTDTVQSSSKFCFCLFFLGFFPFFFSWSHVTARCSAFSGTFWWPLSVTLRRHPGVKSALLVSLVDRRRCRLAGKRANISDDSNGETTAADSWAASRVEVSPNPPSFDARHDTREWRRLVQGQEIWSRGTSVPLGLAWSPVQYLQF